jgi:Rieske Fe-S protein
MADQLTRRTTLAGAAGLAAALPVLAACGGGDSGSASASGSKTTRGAGAPDSATPGTVVGSTSEIPVGEGKIFGDLNVVVTQPEAGTFKAFSATCTHMGCQVSSVQGGTINCGCHFSKFSVSDGAVEGGPATHPLPDVAITVANDQITLA